MFWIEGIERTDQGFALSTVSPDGICNLNPLNALNEKLPGKVNRKRITTDCATWTKHSAEPFWDYLRLNTQPKDNHAVFVFTVENKTYLLPTAVFIAAMMRPIKWLHKYLFRPQGLELMSLPILDQEKPTVGFYESEDNIIGNPRNRSDGLLAGISWMHCFPSAKAMWDSVYLSALKGNLEVSPPLATASLISRSITVGNYELVTDITLLSLQANEAPYDFAASHPSKIFLHDSAKVDWSAVRTQICQLQSRNGEWHLSDQEWALIEQLFAGKRATQKYDRRAIIDITLIKLGTNTPWHQLNYGQLNFNIVQGTYRSLLKNGTWKIIEKLLNESRRKTAEPPVER